MPVSKTHPSSIDNQNIRNKARIIFCFKQRTKNLLWIITKTTLEWIFVSSKEWRTSCGLSEERTGNEICMQKEIKCFRVLLGSQPHWLAPVEFLSACLQQNNSRVLFCPLSGLLYYCCNRKFSKFLNIRNKSNATCLLLPPWREREREREKASFINKPQKTHLGFGGERVRELKPLKPSFPKPSSSSLFFRRRMHARLARSWRRPHPSIGRYSYIGIFLCLELVSWACHLRLVLAWPSIRALLHCFWTRNTCRPCRRRLHRRRRFF